MAANGEPRVFEVSFKPRSDPRQFRCTCPGWQLRGRCRHAGYVAAQVEIDHGYSPPLVHSNALRTLTAAVSRDMARYRTWLYDHTQILIIDQLGHPVVAPKTEEVS